MSEEIFITDAETYCAMCGKGYRAFKNCNCTQTDFFEGEFPDEDGDTEWWNVAEEKK